MLLPLILPGIITGVALLTFFSFVGLSLSSGFPLVPGWPVVLGHAAALTSVVITQVFARLQRLDRAQEEASQDLYANEWQTFWYVTFPSIRTAVLGAGLLVFTLSLDEIAVTFFLIGRQNTLPLQIWGLLRRGITPEVNAAAAIIFLAVRGGHRGLGQADAGGPGGLTDGARFDIRQFHAHVLGNGGVTLPMLRCQVERWVAGDERD